MVKKNKKGLFICSFCMKMRTLNIKKHNCTMCKSIDCECFCDEKKKSLKEQIAEYDKSVKIAGNYVIQAHKSWKNKHAPFNGADLWD